MANRNNRSFNPRKRDFGARREPRRISASNAVVNAVINAAAVYGQPAYRMQSRCFTVQGTKERGERPLFIGQWDDVYGNHHFGGMPDVLVTPCIWLPGPIRPHRVQVALWCECKSGRGRLTEEQEAFRRNVEETGGFWLECRDSADALLAWFREHGVTRP